MSNTTPLPAPLREQAILRLVQEEGTVRVRDLVQRFGVTPMTVWRDLRRMEEQGLVRGFHGGVTALRPAVPEPGFESKSRVARQAKVSMALHVSRDWIRSGMSVAVEGGTTASAVIDMLPRRGITIVTNSLPVASRVRQLRPELLVWLPGGSLNATSGNLCGPEAIRALRRHHTDLCLISATGMTITRGLLDPNPLEIEAKRAMCEASAATLVLLDSRKFGRESAFPVLATRRVRAVVTERAPPEEYVHWWAEHGVPVQVAPSD
ncbi:DeoR/GlpR family DNA-binding transcription regulator [Nibricoccus sp. IMCC34717]|uniref:DeoR/GlpR family DNA-binding transcription regulator n=1 Tax=Nibricoccus sp. IMCC34717 TaxID=3034021 RepID=UPI00384D4BDB